MSEYLIHPKAPLLFRNAKPFASGEGSAETLAFPSPATISGALRTAWAEQEQLAYHPDTVQQLRAQSVAGPLLVSMTGDKTRPLFPAPSDSLALHNEQQEIFIHRIAPAATNGDEGCDLPNEALWPLFLQGGHQQKPAKTAPAFWHQEHLVKWLSNDSSTALAAVDMGTTALPIEYRTHVAISEESNTAKDAHLFETAGLDFSPRQQTTMASAAATDAESPRGWRDESFALLARYQTGAPLNRTLRTLGGESRLASIESAPEGLWPECPGSLCDALCGARGFRLYLATPAIFNRGWLPGGFDPKTLEGDLHNLHVKLRAAAIPRWQAGTSWDMTKGKKGKGMRTAQRMVPAGAVYWFEIIKGSAAELIEYWLTSISDQREQDGFGLVLPGVWNPK